MLFVSSPPVQVQIQQDRKIIILTQKRIMFSHLDFIEEYLSLPLISRKPQSFYYSQQSMQVLIKFQNALEVYYCDWKFQIKLLKVQFVQNAAIENIYYEKNKGWNVLGNVKLYDSSRITYLKPQGNEKADEQYVARCYIQKNQFLLTKSQLKRREKMEKFVDVNWKDRMMVLKNQNYHIEMIGAKSSDKQRQIICMNNRYTLIIKNNDVVGFVDHPNTLYIKNSLLINESYRKNHIDISSEKIYNYSDLGSIPNPRGHLHQCYLYDQQLIILSYSDKQININSLPLVNEEEAKKTHEPHKKKLRGSFSKIAEVSQDDASQFVSNMKEQQAFLEEDVASKSPKIQFSRNSKPIIKDVINCCDDKELGNTDPPLNKKDSVVIERSRIEGEDHEENLHIKRTVSYNVDDFTEKKENKQPINDTFNEPHNDSFKVQSSSSQNKKNGKQQNKRMKTLNNHSQSSAKNNLSFPHIHHETGDGFQTPGFGFQIDGGDWDMADRNWEDKQKLTGNLAPQIKQDEQAFEEESQVIDESQRQILPHVPGILSKKVQHFKPSNKKLTQSIIKRIQSETYSKLIEQKSASHPEAFEDLCVEFMYELLQEKQSVHLFLEKIRTPNPRHTIDRIKRIFRLYMKDSYKPSITRCLQKFKLSEVPLEILDFPLEFTKLIHTLDKELEVEELLYPSEGTYVQILQSYFKMRLFETCNVLLQDEEVDICLPRNMLNVLLYINNFLNIPLQSVFRVYFQKLIIEDHIPVIAHIIEEKIFQICNVDRSVLDQILIEHFKEMMMIQNTDPLTDIVNCLSSMYIEEYKLKLVIAVQFARNQIVYSIQELLLINDASINIYTFLENVIEHNYCKSLANLDFASIYRTLIWIQDRIKIIHMTNQFVLLIKALIQKFCQMSFFTQAFHHVKYIHASIKKSFVAYLLYKYANSKFINRLAQQCPLENLEEVFPEFFDEKQAILPSLPRDKMQTPQFSDSLSCSWSQFLAIFRKNLRTEAEVEYLTYLDLNCSYQLFLYLDELKKSKFQKFFLEIEQYIITNIDDINENDESINPKGEKEEFFMEHLELMNNQSQANLTSDMQDQFLNVEDVKKKKNQAYKSMAVINLYNQIEDYPSKANSDKIASQEDMQQNQDILRLKWLVTETEIYQALSDIFMRFDGQTFLKGLKHVDLEKIKLYHLDEFKSILHESLDYPIQRIIDFKVFTIQDPIHAFDEIQNKIRSEINLQNFWVIYLIVEIMFGLGVQVAKIFLKKLILYYQNDELVHVVKELIMTTQLKNNKKYLKDLALMARDYNLDNIAKVLAH